MKLNWGYGLMIGMALFMGFIITLSVKMMRQKVDLVSKNYYEEGIMYQQHIDEVKQTAALDTSIQVSVNHKQEKLEVLFPAEFKGKQIEGNILLFRPSNSEKDMRMEIKPGADMVQTIPMQGLDRGVWKVKVEWQSSGHSFYFEEYIYI